MTERELLSLDLVQTSSRQEERREVGPKGKQSITRGDQRGTTAA